MYTWLQGTPLRADREGSVSNVTAGLALLAMVLTVSALASGIVARAPLSFPMIFLGLGMLLGPGGSNGDRLLPPEASDVAPV